LARIRSRNLGWEKAAHRRTGALHIKWLRGP
jgi:hypothetical protein